jgi:hypothetical protein
MVRNSHWLNYEVAEEEWKLHWKEHIAIIKELQEEGWLINLMIFNNNFLFKGEEKYVQ